MIRLHDILDMVSAYIPDADLDVIRKAYVFSAKAHQGQTRRSGEPYLVHPMEVAGILAEMKLDVPSIATALLHDTVEDTVATIDEVEGLFGEEIKNLVDGVTKLSKIQFTTTEERQAENFRKMIMAMAKDIRVIIVKLADRVHNMRTLEHLPENRREAIARETIDIYAPIANRLGIQQIKTELEDLALKHLKPDIYGMIDEQVRNRAQQRDKFITEVRRIVVGKTREHNIECEIYGRLKHYHSIWRKMEDQHIPFDQVHDVVAFRIIVDTLQQCYEALGVIHSLWRPVPGRFKDYIAMPKGNGYQSLHTTVIGPHGDRVEFQIRTREMHESAEHGIAAHWKYKEGRLITDKDEMKFKWIRKLLEWQSELSDPSEFLDTVRLDLFADDVYVFSPAGMLLEFPRGSTPIDFAYAIHSDVGNCCIGAKVNGKIVPLRYEMHSGDTVEILTGKQKQPHKDWLAFVKTSRAKAKIRQFIRSEDKGRSSQLGRELLEKECRKYGLGVAHVLKSKELDEFASKSSYDRGEGILSAIGYGRISPAQIIALFVPHDQLHPEDRPRPKDESVIGKIVKKLKRSKGMVKVGGMSDMMVSFGKCCNPVPGDPIVGYVTRGRGVVVHVKDCERILGQDDERYINVEWDMSSAQARAARVKAVCADRPGILAKMTEAISDQGANIVGASIKVGDDKTATNLFEIEIKDVSQLKAVIKALERVKGMISVERVRE
ncbi:MAG: bifunctional (p)ppGpp synthetase/guanosine-3',5'-bis(diphosphate) 3'-pyrophosphohydrolase [Proteobacteria bacterium]|nr:bifunctional (p)ppGpp synthetase/guanosine-3',5'-bis(diphosphate) 3'-pyrophosphohydrolase [Pseudomonadota bacterium]